MPRGRLKELQSLQRALSGCRCCDGMTGPPVHGQAVLSAVFLLGQAPGTKEIVSGQPFCWTAGKTLFRWFEGIGLPESAFRRSVYMSAVCRCFPGKHPRGGDRVPARGEIEACAQWWQRELALVRPRLVIAVGRLAISRFAAFDRLDTVIGSCRTIADGPAAGADLIPLPHPSGASTWFKTAPGKDLLPRALALIEAHPAWRELVAAGTSGQSSRPQRPRSGGQGLG